MLKLNNVTKKYKIPNNGEVVALKDINLEFNRTGFVCIVGKSGSGKSTLLNLLGGIDHPTNGEVTVYDRNLKDYKNLDFDCYRNFCVGFVFQDYNLLQDCSVAENIEIAIKLQEKNRKVIVDHAESALREVDLMEYKTRKITELSGGQQQRVAIARALAKDYEVILCDEPTGNLDNQTALEIIKILKKISETKLIIMVTHDEDIAKVYGDRIIRLQNGTVSEDTKSLVNRSTMNKEKERKSTKLGFKEIANLTFGNIRKSLISSLVILLILVITCTLLINFCSLSQFDSHRALLNTMNENGTGVVPVTKYIDKVFKTENGDYIYGPSFEENKIIEEDNKKISDKIDSKAEVLKAYFFNKNLQDFVSGKLQVQDGNFLANCFSEYIVVPDFSKFNQELLFGDKPTASNEILIYDYMAHNLIVQGVVSQKNIKDVIGVMLTDNETKLSIKISGILRSNYQDYHDIDNINGDYEFESSYLMSLQSIYCRSDFVGINETENEAYPVFDMFFFEPAESVGQSDKVLLSSENKKVYMKNSVESFQFIGGFNWNEEQTGILLSVKQFADIFDVPESQVTQEFVVEKCTGNTEYSHLVAQLKYSDYEQSMEKPYTINSQIGVVGVYSGGDNDKIFLWQSPEFPSVNFNGAFRQFYVSFGNNQSDNYDVLKSLEIVEQTDEFYLSNLDYYYEDFTVYTPYLLIIQNAESYLEGISDMGNRITIIVAIFTIVGICFFTYSSIKRNKYKIGVLKSMGARNSDITIMFGVEILFISLVAFAISIFTAQLLINSINYDFTGNLEYNIRFFSINIQECLFAFGLTIITVFVSTSLPLIQLFVTSPAKIIRDSKLR